MIITTKPYKHQLNALNLAFGKASFALFMEQGTGKSKILIDEIVNLADQKLINCVIILAPNQLHKNWADEFAIHAPRNYELVPQIWKSGSYKNPKFETTTRSIIQSGKVLIFLMNIEAVSHASGVNYIKRILSARSATYMVVDESHKIKTPGALRTKNIRHLSKLTKYRRIATGTEAMEGIENLYSQLAFLSPTIIGSKTYTAFKGMYCVMGGYENRQIIGYQNQEVLATKISPHIFQIRKKDCLDLPDQVYVKHKIELTVKQHELYYKLRDELIIEFKQNEIIDATLAITRLMRLQQILCGHLGGEMLPSHRANLVAELIDTADKSIVFCRFIKDTELVAEELSKAKIGFGLYHGGLTPNQRDENLSFWRQNKSNKAIIMTGATGGLGLTLNEANNTIFYSNSWSATERYQSESRNHRIGQEQKVTYHDIVVHSLVDDKLLQSLRAKENAADKFRNLVNVMTFLNVTEQEHGRN